jgi:hypothetical protein
MEVPFECIGRRTDLIGVEMPELLPAHVRTRERGDSRLLISPRYTFVKRGELCAIAMKWVMQLRADDLGVMHFTLPLGPRDPFWRGDWQTFRVLYVGPESEMPVSAAVKLALPAARPTPSRTQDPWLLWVMSPEYSTARGEPESFTMPIDNRLTTGYVKLKRFWDPDMRELLMRKYAHRFPHNFAS